MRVTYSGLAELDLESIFEFGSERWGEEQAERYLVGLVERIGQIAGSPQRHAAVEHLGNGTRSFAHRSHRVFYLPGDGQLLVVRILHASQDTERYLT